MLNDLAEPGDGPAAPPAATAPAYVTPPRLTFWTKLAYGSGSIAFGVKDIGFQTFLLIFFNQVMGVPAVLVGTAIMIATIVDAVIDPVIGYWSDHTRTRWGRRHPFMYAAAIPTAIFFFLVWNPPVGWSDQAMFVYIVATVIAVRVSISFFEIPATTFLAELADDYDERNSVVSYRVILSILGGTAVTMVTLLVFMAPTPDYPNGQLNPHAYVGFSIMGSIAMFVFILVAAVGTHSRIPYLHQAPPQAKQGPLAILREVAETMWNRSYVAIVLTGIFTSVSGGIGTGLGIYINTYFWEFTTEQLSLFTIPGIIALVGGIVLGPIMGRRYGKKNAAIGMLVVTITISAAPGVLRLLELMPPNGSTLLLVIVLAANSVMGILGLASVILIASMVADVMEDSELKTGRRSEGLLFSAQAFIAQVVSGVGIFMAGMILSIIAFPESAKPSEVDPETIRALMYWSLPISTVFSGLALFCLSFYGIDRATHEANLAILRARRAAAGTR